MVVLKTFWRCTLHSMGKESQLHLQQTKVWVRVRSVQSTKKNVGQIVHLIKAGPRDVLGWNRERILTIHVSINLCTDSKACIMSVNVELIVPSFFSSLLQNFFFRGKFRSCTISVGPAESPAYWFFFSQKVVSSNPICGEVYSIQHYVIKFVSDLRQVRGFLWVLQFPPPIKLKYCWKYAQ